MLEKQKEIQKERLEELFKLIKENPDLPILPMVDGEIVSNDKCAYWMGSWGSAYIGEYYITDGEVFEKDEDLDEIEKVLSAEYGYDVFKYMSDVAAVDTYNKLPWRKAIIVYIDLPEV